VNGQIDANAPASLSNQTVTGVLRDELGWDGVVVTDDLQAAAITDAFGFDDSVQLAIEAGNDLLLFANQQVYQPKVVNRVIDLVEGFVTAGRITEARIDDSVARVARLFNRRAPGAG
jgi:beta-N-acetylhexosaminidase